jgi:multisubunit Na+/H+ antiporter MnhC subunit
MPDAAAVASAVTTSFAFGWQMARLYNGPLSSVAEPRLEEDLPGLSELPASELVTLGLAQADAALGRLKAFLGNVALPVTDAVRAATETPAPDRAAIRKAILDLHVAVLVQLTAADFRLGKEYGLGRALADTCARARGDETERRQALVRRLERDRLLVIVGWLDDLRTVLPGHAGHGVADSLQRWERWAEAASLAAARPAAIDHSTLMLHRCGQRWRALLSGEKAATDLLEIGDYVNAARGTLARAAAIARELALQLWALLALAGVLLGIGIWLIIADHSTVQVLAGLGTVAGGLGVTWRSAAGSLKHVSFDLVRPLWEAQLDAAVAARLTPVPQRDYLAEPQRPAGRWRRAWHAARQLGISRSKLRPAAHSTGSGQGAASIADDEIEPSSADGTGSGSGT